MPRTRPPYPAEFRRQMVELVRAGRTPAELGQLSCGRTAVDDLEGNALLWTLGTLAYQLLHSLRTTALRGRWRTAQPDRLRAWIFRLPAKLTRHARKLYLQLLHTEPVRQDLLRGLRRLGRAPPLIVAS